MADRTPLSTPLATLLSQALVAFTIEFDNEAERQLNETSLRPWLVSLAMWSNFLRFVDGSGVRVHELQALSRVSGPAIASRLGGFTRWRYVVVEPDPADDRAKPPKRDWLVTLTPAGRKARSVWEPLHVTIEQRWVERFGADEIGRLRASLEGLAGRIDVDLPLHLPIVGYSMFAEVVTPRAQPSTDAPPGEESRLELPTLVSRVLLAFTLEFERGSNLSLPIGADVLRVLDESGVRVRDLPLLAGVSKEAVSVTVGFLEKAGYVVVRPDTTASRTKVARLTNQGRQAQAAFGHRLSALEETWERRFGADDIRTLRESLQGPFDRRDGQGEPLMSEGLVPPEGCWRARKPYLTATQAMLRDPTGTLPHYPMLTHRGGFPDGA